MTTYTTYDEARHAGWGLLSEADGTRSRESITIASGAGVVAVMTVLGQIKLGDVSRAAKSGGNTGTGTLTLDATTPKLAGAKAGIYTLRFVTATNFTLTDPNGDIIGTYAIGGSNGNSVTVSNEVKFALVQAATVFVIGDGFDITVAAGSLKYVPSDIAALDGSQVAACVNLYPADATNAAVTVSAIVRAAEINSNCLTYHASRDTDAEKLAAIADLKAAGVIAR